MPAELWLILGMMVVTAVPRLLPALLPAGFHLPSWLARWLDQVPYAALGALIIPGVFQADPASFWPGAAGGVAALAVALRAPAFVAALASVVAMAAVKLATG